MADLAASSKAKDGKPDSGGFIHALRQVCRILPYVKDMRGTMALLVISLVMVALSSIPTPFLFKSIIDQALPRSDAPVLVGIVVALLLARLLGVFFETLGSYLLSACSQRVALRLRSQVFASYLALPFSHYLETPTGKMVNRVVSDTGNVANFISKTLWVVPLPLLVVSVGAAVMFSWHATMATYVLLTIPTTMFLTKRLGRKLRTLHQDQREQQEAFQGQVSEVVDNIRVVRSFAGEDRFDNELGIAVTEFGNFSMRRSYLSSSLRSANRIIETGFTYLFIIFGAYLVITNQLTLGEFFAFKLFQEMLSPQINMLYNYLAELPNDTVAVERTLAILEMTLEAGRENPRMDPGSMSHNGRLLSDIVFDNVGFAYPDGTVALTDISFTIKPGQSIALVGPSGSGKSTITSLLLGLYQPSSGRILIDGRDSREWHPADLRSVIGMIYQEAELFDRTVRENLRIAAPDANDAECWRALEIAHAAEFIREIPEGLDAIVGSRGVKLSGGQRQRLCIARAVIRDPPLLVLDEATSALDSISERAIQEAIAEISKQRTTVVVAHRLSTIAHADCILVFDHGRIVERGTHSELAAGTGLYRSLYDSQVQGFLQHDQGLRDSAS
jgi:ABC-type multidrug transport system fused ATPase/permease subunit